MALDKNNPSSKTLSSIAPLTATGGVSASAPPRVSVYPQRRYSPLELWHLLSLDAPTVATLWTVFVARAMQTPIGHTFPLAMFLAVWTIYVADRLLDARHSSVELGACHRFHRRHAKAFVATLSVALLAISILLFKFDPLLLRAYLWLSLTLFFWFALVHSTRSRRLPKELAVGTFFSVAVFLPKLIAPASRSPSLFACVFVFAAVCTLNCFFLRRRENPHASTKPRSAIVFAAACMVSAFFYSRQSTTHLWTISAACALSTLLLIVLDHMSDQLEQRFGPLALRAAADLALLTPCLFFTIR